MTAVDGPTHEPADDLAPLVPWRRALREVLVIAALVVVAVLGAAMATSALPDDVQRVVFHTPLAIILLLIVTAWILWRIAGRRPPEG